jgi:hypothetical protein
LGDQTYPAETLQASVCRGLRLLLVRAVPTMARHRAWDEEAAAEEDEAAAAADAEDNDGGAGECSLCTVTFYANHAHNLTRSP